MICPNCQKEIPDNVKACGHCGHWLAKGKKPPPPTDPTWRSRLWLWVGVSVASLLLVTGTIAFLIGRSSSGTAESGTTSEIQAGPVVEEDNSEAGVGAIFEPMTSRIDCLTGQPAEAGEPAWSPDGKTKYLAGNIANTWLDDFYNPAVSGLDYLGLEYQ